MRVLVFEPDHSGHHFNYLRLLLPALTKLGVEVIAAVAEDAPGRDEFRTHLRQLPPGVAISPTLRYPTGGPMRAAMQSREMLMIALRRLRPDHVYIPYADGLTQIVGALDGWRGAAFPGTIEIEALLMRGGFAYPSQGLKSRVSKLATLACVGLSPWSRLHFIDPVAFEFIKQRGGQLAHRSRLMPDPVEVPHVRNKAESRRLLGIPMGGRYIGCFGVLDERKGTDLLLKAFASADLGESDNLLLIGRLSPAIRGLLDQINTSQGSRRQIITLDRYATDEELQLGLSACDLVATPYPRHIGSASIVIRAAAAGRPVIAGDFGWMRAVVPRFQLGWTCDVSDLALFARSIRLALDASSNFAPSDVAQRFARFHSPANFAAAWTSRLRERLSLPQLPHDSWSELLQYVRHRSETGISPARVGAPPLAEQGLKTGT